MIFQINFFLMISFVRTKKKNLCSTNIYFKMSSFKMETLKLMEKKIDGNNLHLWKFKMHTMFSKHEF
jgi:hypothetical protein